MKKLAVLVICVLLATWTFAEEKTNHYTVAKEYVETIITEENLKGITEQVLNVMLATQPELEKYKPTLLKFFDKYFSVKDLKEEYVKMYMDYFTEKELSEMSAFYKTETGKKAINLQPVMFQKGSEISKDRFQKYFPELIDMIKVEVDKEKKDEIK